VPKPVSREKALRDKLRETAGNAIDLNSQLELVVSFKPRQPSSVFHGKIDFAQPPWYAPVANAILDLHSDVRRLEKIVRQAQSLPIRPRGGSSANTVKAVEALCALSEAADEFSVRMVTTSLGGWCRRASIALSITEPPKRIPRNPGESEPSCPWCKHRTLRLFPLDEKVKCIDPECVDEEKRRPEAVMKYSPVVGDYILVWMDKVPA
jgi:hypothetical protein